MTDATTPDWAELLSQAKPRTKSIRLCLRGDLLSDLADATSTGGQPSLGGETEDVTLLRKQVEEASVTFVVKGLTRSAYSALEAQYPDPKGDGWDMARFPEALVRACLVSPVVEADQPLAEALTYGEFERLFSACISACIEVDDVPLQRRG